MRKDVPFRMITFPLFHAFHRRDFREDGLEKTVAVEQPETLVRVRPGEKLGQLVTNALAAHHLDFWSQVANRIAGCRLDLEIQISG